MKLSPPPLCVAAVAVLLTGCGDLHLHVWEKNIVNNGNATSRPADKPEKTVAELLEEQL